MYYTYLLRSKINPRKLYIGFTARNMKSRLQDHNQGKVNATKSNRPWELIYCEVYKSEVDARRRERMLKQYGSSLGHLKKRLTDTLRTKKGGVYSPDNRRVRKR